jgi:hypothetical protein
VAAVVTRLSSRLTVSALALVAVAALFGLGAPRPRAAVRDRLARTVVRVGSLRATGQSGSQSGDDHQADAVHTADDLASATRSASASGSAVGTSVADGTAAVAGTAVSARHAGRHSAARHRAARFAHLALNDRTALRVHPDVVTAVRLPVPAAIVVSCTEAGPAAGRAPPAV